MTVKETFTRQSTLLQSLRGPVARTLAGRDAARTKRASLLKGGVAK